MQGPATAAARVALRLRQFSGLRATTSRESLPLLARWPRRMALSALAGPVAPAPDSGNQEKKRAGRGARPGRGRPEKGRAPGGTHQLLESDPLYQPLLPTGADAEGHRCGFVAIIGRPNAGKSTLLNCLLGQKLSIVTAKAQTTRHKIAGFLSEPRYQVILLDTPGVITKANSGMEERMMAAVKEAVQEADAVVALVDSSDRPEEALSMLEPGDGWQGPPLCLVLNKMDLLGAQAASALMSDFRARSKADTILAVSAKEAKGIVELKEWMVSKMPEGPSLFNKDYLSQAPERFFVSEIIREKIFEFYRQEIPYCCQVNVVEFKERKVGKDFIKVEILVEKDGQRGILMGAGGTAIKRLNTAARLDIEAFLGRPVFLEMTVKAQKGWRDDADLLKRYGY